MEKKLILFLVYLFISIGLVTAQSRKVTGVVISSEDDLPIVGATILMVSLHFPMFQVLQRN